MPHLIGILLAAGMTCADVSEKINRVRNHKDLTPQQREEVVEIYSVHLIKSLGMECDWDAND